MGKVLLEEQSLIDIANSIRNKTGSSETMTPNEMATNIDNVESASDYFGTADFSANASTSVGRWFTVIDKIPAIDTTGVTDFRSFYSGFRGKTIDLSKTVTSGATGMYYMFAYNTSLETLINLSFDTSKVTTMEGMFYSNKIPELILTCFDTASLTNINHMFNMCSNLKTLDMSSFDMSKVNSVTQTWKNCNALTNLKFGYNLGKGYTEKTVNYSSYTVDLSLPLGRLTHESLMSVINGLYDLNLTYDVANGGTLYTQSLRLSTLDKAKLNEEEIAIATNKGWVIS